MCRLRNQSRQKHLLAATGMMEAFPHAQFPLDGVVGLIEEGAGHRHLRIGKHRIPARLLVLKPLAHTVASGLLGGVCAVVRKAPQPLAQGNHRKPSRCGARSQRVWNGVRSLLGRGTRWPSVSSGA